MKKILICASRVSHILNFHLPYIQYFKNRGYIVDIAVQGMTDHPLIDHCYDMRFTKNPLSPDNLRTIRQLRQLIVVNGYDMMYSNSTLAGAAARLAVKGMKQRPYCIHISHGYMFKEHGGLKSRVYLYAEKLTKNVTDDLIVMNREDWTLARKYQLGKKIHYIYGMGLDEEKFPVISQKEKKRIRHSMNISDSDKMLLCVGEFSDRKNQTAIITALNDLVKIHKNIMLVLAGEGNTLESCRQLVHEYELDRYVRFRGQVQDTAPLYRCSDLLVTAAKMEGLPFNVMEALYCGVPVVASSVKGHADLIRNGENGLLTDHLLQSLDRILSDSALYEKLKANAFLDEKYLLKNAQPALLKILDREYREEITV